MINILCGSAARYPRVYHARQDDPRAWSIIAGLNLDGCLQQPAGMLGPVGDARPITRGYCSFDRSGSALIAAVDDEIASLALLPTTMRPAEANVSRPPRAGPRRQPGARSSKRAFVCGVAPDFQRRPYPNWD